MSCILTSFFVSRRFFCSFCSVFISLSNVIHFRTNNTSSSFAIIYKRGRVYVFWSQNICSYSLYLMRFTITNKRTALPPKRPENTVTAIPSKKTDTPRGRNIWGPPTWEFMHTMVENVSEETFQQECDNIIAIIVGICTNLPCPICADHAREYIVRVGPVRSRAGLREWLWRFHNGVRERTGGVWVGMEVLKRYAGVDLGLAWGRMAGSWRVGRAGATARRSVLGGARGWAARWG